MNRVSAKAAGVAVGVALALVRPAEALVYCVTNAVDYHRSAPTGVWANSGWQEAAVLVDFMGTFIQTNALLTARHLTYTNGTVFSFGGVSRTVTAVVDDTASDLKILFFTPGVTNVARLNIETNDVSSVVVLQGGGLERGAPVVTGGVTNGWLWGRWRGIRRWGVNRYFAEDEGDDTLAVASFDNNGDPDECMMSPGDSGGPGFIRTPSGWKLATVNSATDPVTFTASTNPVSAFNATLYDCAGLFYTNGSPPWVYVPPGASPYPCRLYNTRTSKRVAWITNTVAGITFPADVGVAWRCQADQPSAAQAAQGVWFEVVATNAGPYVARNVAVEIAWPTGLCVRAASATAGSYYAGRWSLPALADGSVATLRVDTVVWRSESGGASNRAWVAASDKPDLVATNDEAFCAIRLPATATRLLVE